MKVERYSRAAVAGSTDLFAPRARAVLTCCEAAMLGYATINGPIGSTGSTVSPGSARFRARGMGSTWQLPAGGMVRPVEPVAPRGDMAFAFASRAWAFTRLRSSAMHGVRFWR